MISATSATSSPHAAMDRSLTRASKLAALGKEIEDLHQQLARARETKPEQLAGLRSNVISQDIVSAQSQIDKVLLEAQLSKLTLGIDASVTQSQNLNAAKSGAPDSPGALDPQMAEPGQEQRSEARGRPSGLPEDMGKSMEETGSETPSSTARKGSGRNGQSEPWQSAYSQATLLSGQLHLKA